MCCFVDATVQQHYVSVRGRASLSLSLSLFPSACDIHLSCLCA